MKTGWQTRSLGDLCEIELGKTPSRANASFWDEKRESGNVWLSIADLLKTDNSIVVDSKEYVSDKGAAICKLVPKGTLLVSFKLTLGRLAFAGRDLFTNEAIAALTIFNERELSKEFLFYCLTFFDWVKAAENDVKLKGMTLNKAKLKVMPVSFPALPEQQRIVTLLDEAFDGIATAKANAEKNLQNARAIFESHLQSVISQRGNGWALSTLGETYDVRDGTHDSPKYHDMGFPLITSKNLKRDGLSFDDVRLIDAADYRKINERSAVHKGDVLLAMIGTIGNPVVVEMEPEFAIKNVALLKVPAHHNSHFLRYYLSSQFVVAKMQSEAKGTTQKFVGLGYLRAFPILIPSVAEQAAVVSALDELTNETNRLEEIFQQKLTSLDELKKSLLHRAFNGDL
jgi:type I restriction enzyme, S subunit